MLRKFNLITFLLFLTSFVNAQENLNNSKFKQLHEELQLQQELVQ